MASLAEIRAQYPQYQDMSDDALASSLHQKFYSDMPRDDFNKRIGFSAPAQPTPAPDTETDVVKSAGVGLAKGGIGALGLPGDVGSLVARGAEAVGLPEGFRKTFGKVARTNPFLAPFAFNPGSQAIQGAVEQNLTGEFYKPQTTAGKYAQTIGEFAPAAAIPGGLVTRVARAVVPGAASEAAGQATEGSRAEPYARIAAALAGGSLTNAAAPATKVAAPTAAVLKGSATSVYKNPAVTGAPVSAASTSRLGDDIAAQLRAEGGRPRNMQEVFASLDEFKALGPRPTVADVRSVRENLSAIAQNKVVSAPKESRFANQAVREVDRFLDNVSPQLRDANANYAASMRAEALAKTLRRAERQANAANSGQNIDNATRQQFKNFINNERRTRGFSADELAQMDRVVEGTRTGNAARYMGNLLGGGGGLGQLVTAGVLGGGGYAAGGEQGMLAGLGIAGLGKVGKGIGNASTNRQVRKLDEMVRSRSPVYRSAVASPPPPRITEDQRRALMVQMLLAASPINQSNQQPSY